MEENSPIEQEFHFQTVGEQLKTERERLELSLSDLAAKTRVPIRHLASIENSEFEALPGTTYTLGFMRSYARAVGLDAAKLNAELRKELAQGGHDGYQAPTQNYDPTDPSRVPSRALAWTAAGVGVVLVAAYLIWRSMAFNGAADVSVPIVQQQPTSTAPGLAEPPVTGGAVVLTATDDVWVKVYDADNKRLYENEMKAGDSFIVPPDANKPMIVTGRPQTLTVTVGGKPVPALGEPDKTIADVEVSAAALLARSNPANNSAPESQTTKNGLGI